MTKQEFIEQIAKYVQQYAKSYGISVHSPIIAQAILESASGTSELAVNAHNYFGLKYREGRCPTCIGTYAKVGSEQNPDGSYVSSAMIWCKFASMEDGVIGYFDFTNISNYANLKGVTDPKTYLENIKADGYATSINYVSNLLNVIDNYDLRKYDNTDSNSNKEESTMSNSSLVNCKVMSPNHSGKRTHKIDRITPHCVVGQLTAESIGGCFTSSSRQASCNYGIGKDGRICLIVDEANRSWCSSSNANDQRAVTIECASDMTDPYAMTNEVYNSLINLCVDICKRNGANKLIWFGDKNTSLNYEPKDGEMVITVHRWFANKACPGDWLYNRLGDLASKVTSILGGSAEAPSNPGSSGSSGSSGKNEIPAAPFTVQVLISDLNYRSEPSMSGKVNGVTGKGVFTIVEVKNGWGKLKSGAGWIYLENPSYCTIQGKVEDSTPSKSFQVKVSISDLRIRKGPGTNYGSNGYTGKGVFTITETSAGKGSTKGWGKLKSGAGWISLDYATRI